MEIVALIYFSIALILVVYMLWDSPIKIKSGFFVVVLGACIMWPLTLLLFMLEPE